jgi:indole-3-glycerol phosphate synthase
MGPVSATPGSDFLAVKGAEVRRRRSDEHGTQAPDAASSATALRACCQGLPPAPSLSAVLAQGETVAVMAEFKRRSPSAGGLAEGEHPVDVATAYLDGGAVALSVLTDEAHFGGSLVDLALVAGLHRTVPVLRKDFIVDAAQVLEARLTGAAGTLLIVGMLDDRELVRLLAAAGAVGCECLVEIHDEAELDRAAAAGATLLGINNRDLRLLTTDLATTERLAPRVPAGAVIVSESGIRTADDVRRVRDAGAHAVLVGEALLREPPAARAARLRELAGVPR